MNESDDPELDALLDRDLRDHLARVLEPHAGRAAEAFLAHAGAAQGAAADVGAAGSFRLRWWALAAGGLAACIAAAWMIQNFIGPRPIAPTPRLVQDEQPPVRDEPREVLRSVTWRTLDEDTVVLDDVPLHRLRRQVIETEQWYDAERKTHIEVTTPRQEVIFVGMRQQ